MPGTNLAVGQYYINQCLSMIPQGLNLQTWLKTCFFIYDQNPSTCTIRIEDHSELIQAYNPLTDVHTVTVGIYDEEGVICYTTNLNPFGNLSIDLPGNGKYTVEINVEYTIQYVGPDEEIFEHTFQIAYIYPIECVRSSDYHNTLLKHIDCLLANNQCEIQRRKCVGREYCDLQDSVYALNNYRYALCCLEFSVEEFDQISCAVKQIKKAC